MRVHWIVFTEIVLACAAASVYYYWPQLLILPERQMPQQISDVKGIPVVSWPGRYQIGNLHRFDHVLPAYLLFDYIRSQRALKGKHVMLTSDTGSQAPRYWISLLLQDDVSAGVEELAELRASHLSSLLERSWVIRPVLRQDVQQTNSYIQIYNNPEFPTLDEIPDSELEQYVAQFISFKSSVDPRTWNGDTPLLPPTAEDAETLAADIVEVARFYNLPVDALLGIGAMENNFLNAPGDLNNAIWKKDVGTDDIVLRRKGRRAWVLNSSMGVWQITRQSLRHAQELFQCDTRDYSTLPIRLRPTEELNMSFLSTHVLTTYAALLLRDLLDYFNGDVFLATGAYNGTKAHPNLQYASGVDTVARYARRVLGNTARLNQMNNGGR